MEGTEKYQVINPIWCSKSVSNSFIRSLIHWWNLIFVSSLMGQALSSMYYSSGFSELRRDMQRHTKSWCPISIDKGDKDKLSERWHISQDLKERRQSPIRKEKHYQLTWGTKKSIAYWRNTKAHLGGGLCGCGGQAGRSRQRPGLGGLCSLSLEP